MPVLGSREAGIRVKGARGATVSAPASMVWRRFPSVVGDDSPAVSTIGSQDLCAGPELACPAVPGTGETEEHASV